MADENKTLTELRAMGVKCATFSAEDGRVTSVEFFPLTLLDRVDSLTDKEPEDARADRSERDTEAPPAAERVPAALARVLQKGSVS